MWRAGSWAVRRGSFWRLHASFVGGQVWRRRGQALCVGQIGGRWKVKPGWIAVEVRIQTFSTPNRMI